MYEMTPMGVFFTAIFPLEINEQALCQQLHFVPRFFHALISEALVVYPPSPLISRRSRELSVKGASAPPLAAACP